MTIHHTELDFSGSQRFIDMTDRKVCGGTELSMTHCYTGVWVVFFDNMGNVTWWSQTTWSTLHWITPKEVKWRTGLGSYQWWLVLMKGEELALIISSICCCHSWQAGARHHVAAPVKNYLTEINTQSILAALHCIYLVTSSLFTTKGPLKKQSFNRDSSQANVAYGIVASRQLFYTDWAAIWN